MRISIMLANANGNLATVAPLIDKAVIRAEEYANDKLGIVHNINLVFAELNHFLIHGDNVGGRTYRADFILITLDLTNPPSESVLFEIICHELGHAARWGVNPEYANTLFDELISESIATTVEESAIAGAADFS